MNPPPLREGEANKWQVQPWEGRVGGVRTARLLYSSRRLTVVYVKVASVSRTRYFRDIRRLRVQDTGPVYATEPGVTLRGKGAMLVRDSRHENW